MMFSTTRGETYLPLRTSEAQFESMIVNLAESVFPAWHVSRWKQRVYTPDGKGVEPDLVMFSKNDFEWVVVEVELARHSIGGHIRDQLERLAGAVYDTSLAASFSTCQDVSVPNRLNYLRRRPGFLCIADEYTAPLRECCDGTGFDLAVLQPYKSTLNGVALHGKVLPGHYRESRHLAMEFVLRSSLESFLGRRSYVLPPHFPDVADMTIMYRDQIWECRIVSLGDSRLMFGPEGLDAERLDANLRLGAVDIANRVFRIAS